MSQSVGDPLPPEGGIIEVRLSELRQLFNALDPSPFRDRDLEAAAAEFIVDSAAELPGSAPLGLLVHLDRPAGPAEEEAAVLRDAVHQYFADAARATRWRLRELFRTGRTSLLIGLAVLAASSGLASLLAGRLEGSLGGILQESVLIGGWVAMWRPLEIFLYDWWPIRAEARRFDRLAAMPVRIRYAEKP
ncbi:MAG TPA: hypothetical protein VG500_07655 [Gemmatimonadales bacterium]|jgi:hypothetical protein|nr:hypothetical protein [Gemmatimonadales bacterium]